VDAKEVLRRYIEQRREVGETELVLDSLHVEEVMRLLGAADRAASGAKERHGSGVSADAPSADWRAAFREADVDVARTGAQAARAPDVDPSRAEEQPPPAPRVGRLDFAAVASSDETGEEMVFKKGLVVGQLEAELIPGPIAKLPSLSAIAKKVQECTRCPLYATATNGVPGEGDPKAGLVCVGEAPGGNEDATGRPFVGQAGQLLTKILAAIDLKREEVFIVNVLKHRPPGNRNPRPEEVEACSPYLIRQLELIKPKVIVAFGTFAAQTLLQTKTPLGQLRGLVHRYHGTPLVVTYHPAALLRNPSWKRPTWEDVKLARRVLDSATRS
jgi:DNA polymerase